MKNVKVTQHELLIEACESAIDELFSDTSVTRGTTAGDLRDLIDQIEMKLATLK